MEKLNSANVYQYFENCGYKVLEEYINSITSMLCEKNEYRYRISYHNLKYGKNPSLWGFSNIENLSYNIQILLGKKQSNTQYLGYDIITKKSKKRILIHFKCQCGDSFDRVLEDVVHKTYVLCPKCTIKKRSRSKRISNKAVEYIKSQGYKVFDETKQYKTNEYIEVEDSLGFRGFVTYANVCYKGSKMSRFDIRINKKYYIYNVNLYAKLNNIDIECLGFANAKKHTRQSLQFKCSCGNEFITSIASFQNGKVRCAQCAKSISRYEFAFKEYLESIEIQYIHQYSYNQCRDILPLPFDFYIPQYNCLIEIDGEGHYHPCNFNQINNSKAIEAFKSTKKHDEIKTRFCLENSIPLLRISYKDFKNNNYQEIFQKFIRELANPN